MVEAVLAHGADADVDQALKAALRLIEKFTLHPGDLSVQDFLVAREAGLSDLQIEHALDVSALWNIFGRLADAFGFHVYRDELFTKGAPLVLRFGYRYPALLWPRMWPRA